MTQTMGKNTYIKDKTAAFRESLKKANQHDMEIFKLKTAEYTR